MKRVFYFLRIYFIDIIVSIVGAVGALYAWNYGQQEAASLIVIFITLLLVIYLRSRAKNFVFSSLTWRRDKEPWVGHGVFQFARVQSSFEITNSDPGYIHSSVLTWSDYKFSFDFKIAKYGIGVLVRAVNLANYVMLQITEKGIIEQTLSLYTPSLDGFANLGQFSQKICSSYLRIRLTSFLLQAARYCQTAGDFSAK